jgi:spore coat protein H
MTRHFRFGTGRLPLAAVVALTLMAGLASADDKSTSGVGAFDRGKVWPVHITLSAEEFAAIQPRGGFGFGPPKKEPAKPTEPARESHRSQFGADLAWGTGSVVVGDQTFEKVGIRYKGNGTIMDTARTIKKSFKIDLDRAGGTGRFAGSKTINLHCGVTDPSKGRETLAYELYRAAGVPASRTALAEVRLTVPGKYDKELLGLYTIVEDVGKPFLKDRFGDGKGLLMKPEGLRDFTDQGNDWERYKKPYAPKRDATADDAKRLIAFAKLVDRADDKIFRKEIGSYLEVDNYLRFLATTAFMANTDSFFGLGHNYYMYLQPKTNRIHFIPWDLDRAFANFGNANQNMDLSLTHPYGGTHRLTERLLATPEIAASYQKLLKELAAGPFAKDRFLKELASFEKVAKELRERDATAAAKRKEGGGGFGPPGGMFGIPPELDAFIKTRTESVAAQLDGRSKGFIPAGFGGFRPPGGRP